MVRKVLVSYLGMLYFRGFFDDTVFEDRRPEGPCYNQDDMWFSAHVAAKGIPRRAQIVSQIKFGDTQIDC